LIIYYLSKDRIIYSIMHKKADKILNNDQ